MAKNLVVNNTKTRHNVAFEKQLLETLPGADITFVNGGYVNLIVNTYWKGFLLALNSVRKSGMFIIGTLEDGKLKMSEKPAIHGGYKKASLEAQRLADIHDNQRFVVFTSLSTFSSKKKKMPEAIEQVADQTQLCESEDQ